MTIRTRSTIFVAGHVVTIAQVLRSIFTEGRIYIACILSALLLFIIYYQSDDTIIDAYTSLPHRIYSRVAEGL